MDVKVTSWKRPWCWERLKARGRSLQSKTLNSLLQHHRSKPSILQCSAFFIGQLSHPYLTTGKTIALTRWTFVGKVMSLLFNMLSRLIIAFLPRSKCLLISWIQSPSPRLKEKKWFPKVSLQVAEPRFKQNLFAAKTSSLNHYVRMSSQLYHATLNF